MDREFLQGLGLEKDAINAIMAKYGNAIGSKETEITNLENEKQKLETKVTQLENAGGNDGDGKLKEKNRELEAEKQQLETEIQQKDQEKADLKKQHKLEMYVNNLGTKDPAYVMDKLSDVELKDDEFVDIDNRVDELKEKHPLLFESEEEQEPPKPVKWSQGGVSTTNNGTMTREEIMKEPNRAKRQQLIKENEDLF